MTRAGAPETPYLQQSTVPTFILRMAGTGIDLQLPI